MNIWAFWKAKTIHSFGRDFWNGTITLNETFEEQVQLKNLIDNFSSSTNSKSQNKKTKKEQTLRSTNKLIKGIQGTQIL